MEPTFAVLGAGTWGSVVANHLAGAGHVTTLWHYKKPFAEEFAATRVHPHLKGFHLHESISVTSDIAEAFESANYIITAVPSQKIRDVLSPHANLLGAKYLVNLSKGIEAKSLKRMSEVIEETTGLAPERIASVYGPSHAEEVMKRIPTTLVAASTNLEFARTLQGLMSTSDLRVYANKDIVGVELGGSVKNVIAIAAGISEGIGFGDNTMAALLTRGLAEITRLGMAMGAELHTFAGLSGVGDLAVTAYSRHSRNRRLGLDIGKGATVQESLDAMGMVVEGVYTAQSVIDLAHRENIEMPICEEMHNILFGGKDPRQAITDLMTRDLRDENLH